MSVAAIAVHRTTMRTLYFFAILFAALALVPAGAHLAEFAQKMKLDAAEYRTVQQIYRGWALFGIVIFAALASILTLVIKLGPPSPGFRPALLALLCIVATQFVFWTWTFPANQTTNNWTVLPAHWQELRWRWEYSHAASAILNLIAVAALILSVLRFADNR